MKPTRPVSLDDARERLRAAVEASGDHTEEWAKDIFPHQPRSQRSVNMGHLLADRPTPPRATTLLAIDEACGGAFLTPPEREWAESRVTR